MQPNEQHIFYMKFPKTKYILEVDIYDLKNTDFDKNYKIPYFYKIINIYDMTTNQEQNELFIIDTELNNKICVTHIDDVYTFTNHAKHIKKNMFCIYQNICYHDNEIYKNIILDNKSLRFYIFDNLITAYKSKEIAFFDGFIEHAQWKLFENGYSGIYKKYNISYKGNLYVEEEYIATNNIKNGTYKKYDMFERIIQEQNYINDKTYGVGYYYVYNLENDKTSIEKRNYYNDNYYFFELSIDDINIKSGYCYFDINITYLYNVLNYIF